MRMRASEDFAQSTVEYAIVTVALLAIVVALAGIWRAGTDGKFAELVEESSSHVVTGGGALDAAAGAKDISLY